MLTYLSFCIIFFFYLENKLDLSSETDQYKDFRFTKWLSRVIKLQSIPFSIFYSEKNKPMAVDYMRLCFFKVIFKILVIYVCTKFKMFFALQKDETLKEAEKILTTWISKLS